MLKYAKAKGTYERIMQDCEDRGELPSETAFCEHLWGTAGILQPGLGHKFFSTVL